MKQFQSNPNQQSPKRENYKRKQVKQLDSDFYHLAQLANGNLERSEVLPATFIPKQKDDIQIHLAYLFASPLVLQTSSENFYYDGLPQIHFKEEFEEIIESIEQLSIKFRYRYQMATEQNLRECLNQDPVGLHFSGHGFQNKLESFNKDRNAFQKNRERGDFLLFEQKNGASLNMYETKLKDILETCNNKKSLKFVVVASCHSYQCGQIFAKAGVEHVICIDQTSEILDASAILFSRTFYSTFYGGCLSVCKSFEQAKQIIDNQISPAEARKFKIIPEICINCNFQITQMEKGSVEYFGVWPKIFKVPSRVEPFMFRSRDMFEILRLLQSESIQSVQVFSLPGLGKSSLLRNVTNHMAERQLYRDGILYLDLHNVSLNDSIDLLLQHLNSSAKQSIRLDETVRIVNHAISAYKNKLLLVLDNLGFIKNETDGRIFVRLLNSIITENRQLSVLFSSNYFVVGLENFKVKRLNPLTKEQSFDLFLRKLPLENWYDSLRNMQQINELNEFTKSLILSSDDAPSLLSINAEQPCQVKHGHYEQCVRKYLLNHALFEMLCGHPLAISMIAPLLINKSLKQLFEMMVNSNIFTFTKNRLEEVVLVQSLEFSLQQLMDCNPMAVDLFYIIGLTHSGMSREALTDIYRDLNIDSYLQSLVELSLVSLDEDRYQVPQFVCFFIDKKLDFSSKSQLYMLLALHFNDHQLDIGAKHERNVIQCLDHFLLRGGCSTLSSDEASCFQTKKKPTLVSSYRKEKTEVMDVHSYYKMDESQKMSDMMEDYEDYQSVYRQGSFMDNRFDINPEIQSCDLHRDDAVSNFDEYSRQFSVNSDVRFELTRRFNNPYTLDPEKQIRKQPTQNEIEDLIQSNPDDFEAYMIHSDIASNKNGSGSNKDGGSGSSGENKVDDTLMIEQILTSFNFDDHQRISEMKIDVTQDENNQRRVDLEEVLKNKRIHDDLKALTREKLTNRAAFGKLFPHSMTDILKPQIRSFSSHVRNVSALSQNKRSTLLDQSIHLGPIEKLYLNLLKTYAVAENENFQKIVKRYGENQLTQNSLVQANISMLKTYIQLKQKHYLVAQSHLHEMEKIFQRNNYPRGVALSSLFQAKIQLTSPDNNDAYLNAGHFATRAYVIFKQEGDDIGANQSLLLMKSLSVNQMDDQPQEKVDSNKDESIDMLLTLIQEWSMKKEEEELKESKPQTPKQTNLQVTLIDAIPTPVIAAPRSVKHQYDLKHKLNPALLKTMNTPLIPSKMIKTHRSLITTTLIIPSQSNKRSSDHIFNTTQSITPSHHDLEQPLKKAKDQKSPSTRMGSLNSRRYSNQSQIGKIIKFTGSTPSTIISRQDNNQIAQNQVQNNTTIVKTSHPSLFPPPSQRRGPPADN